MPECKRCTKRILNETDEINYGYCEICIAEIGAELVRIHEAEIMPAKRWRLQKKREIDSLLKQLREAGMPNPVQGLGVRLRSLAYSLNVKELQN